jgi:hypothetical protein
MVGGRVREGVTVQPVSRRSFLVAGSAVAGAAAAGAGIAVVAKSDDAAPLSDEELEALDQPMLMQVRDAASGEVEILVGEAEVVVTDRALVAKVLRATR